MKFTRHFRELNKNDVNLAGGKGASLGEMTKTGMPVPPGFVVLSTAFEKFLEEMDINVEIAAILHSVNHKKIHTVDDASEKIKALILGAEVPKNIAEEIRKFFKKLNAEYVAVRSSATAEDSASAAWAGQLESYLNTTEKNLLENVKKCWASLFTPRAIFYRFEKGLHKKEISVAVVVQKMVASEKSGIAFSVHPVTQDSNQLIIEAGFGLGEAIVSGQVTPDSYVVEKKPRRILDINIFKQNKSLIRANSGIGNKWKELGKIGKERVLSEKEILKLTETVLKIENHYGFPCDIEWAFEKGRFYIVQSRPITTLGAAQAEIPAKAKIADYQRLFRVVSGGITFLASDIFAVHYKTLECFLIGKDNEWMSYIPKTVIKKTLGEGLAIFGNVKKFESYRNNFEKYIKTSTTFFEKILQKNKPSKSDVKKFLNLASGLFKYYSKTEFFYLDKAYLFSRKESGTILRNNLKKMETVKNQGREYLNKVLFGNGYVNQLFKKVSSQFGISEETLRTYKISEVIELFDGRKVDKKNVADRKNAFMMTGGEGTIAYLEGSEARKLISEFLDEGMKDQKELRGVAANAGIIKGKVKIIPPDYYFDFGKLKMIFEEMEKGDILIAETTSPELMPACRKAGAIITNQGGLLSHAAIVSREMNTPCVVGTGNATEVLKDGDRVEVDGNLGVVKILRKRIYSKKKRQRT